VNAPMNTTKSMQVQTLNGNTTMTNNNSSKYEWCDAAWQGAWLRWEFFGYGLHPNTL